jgi:hypothetical protein
MGETGFGGAMVFTGWCRRVTAAWLMGWAGMLGSLLGSAAHAQSGTVYRCPGNPVLYTDALSAKEARDKGCRLLDGAPITIIQSSVPKRTPSSSSSSAERTASPGSAASGAARPNDSRVDPSEQKARDTDARRILQAELKKEEERLAALQKEFNAGEPERRGDERNYQKYQDRVAEMKAAVVRKEADIAAIKRELAKLPG